MHRQTSSSLRDDPTHLGASTEDDPSSTQESQQKTDGQEDMNGMWQGPTLTHPRTKLPMQFPATTADFRGYKNSVIAGESKNLFIHISSGMRFWECILSAKLYFFRDNYFPCFYNHAAARHCPNWVTANDLTLPNATTTAARHFPTGWQSTTKRC